MKLADLPSGASVFVDANVLVYHFQPHPSLGASCTQFCKRVEDGQLRAYVSSHVLSEIAHRLMTLEAAIRFGWSHAGIVPRMRKHPQQVQQLHLFRQAVEQIPLMGFELVSTEPSNVLAAARITQQSGLLSNDALIAAIMQQLSITALASHDVDFDRLPWVSRYGP